MPETPSTPPKVPKGVSSLHKETPSCPKYTHSTPHDPPTSYSLENKRLALLQDIGDEIPEVPVQWFLDNILPPLPKLHADSDTAELQDTVGQVKQHLVKEGKIKVEAIASSDMLVDSGQQFQSLPSYFESNPANMTNITNSKSSTDPDKKQTPTETSIFANLPNLGTDINQAFCAVATRTSGDSIVAQERFELVHKPNNSPTGGDDYNAHPDGCFIRRPRIISQSGGSKAKSKLRPDSEYAWIDVAMPCEYKVNDTHADINDNVRKILWAMALILRTDPCRRFVYGITIEDAWMRIWFVCRSTVFVTEAFNFLQENEKLIHLVLSFCFATEAQVGWDPTVERISIGDGTNPASAQYKLTVYDDILGETVTVQTVEVISDFGADAIRGRGTRVWKAFMTLNGTSQTVVIKDVWVDANCPREGQILRKLKEQASENDEDRALIEKHFIAILYSGDVLIDGEIDHSLNLIQRGHSIPSPAKMFQLNLTKMIRPGKRSHVSIGAVPSTHPFFAHAPALEYAPKVHYRLVLKQVAQPVYSIPKLPDVFLHLRDAAIALGLITKYRWVHRDISPGNVLVCDSVGLLSDLEYMKSLDQDNSCHKIRTGTINFMACEVASLGYIYNTSAPQTPSFCYNPLHDLESLWWMALWEILYHTLSPDDADQSSQRDDNIISKELKEQMTAQVQAYEEAFPRQIEGSIVRNALIGTQARLHTTTMSCFPKTSQFAEVMAILGKMRTSLFEAYGEAESDFQTTQEINEVAYMSRNIHQKFIKSFEELALVAPKSILTPLHSTLDVLGKRPSTEVTDHDPSRRVKSRTSMSGK